MPRIHLFPVGNGDTSLIEFEDGRLMLIDFCRPDLAEDDEDKRIDIRQALRSILEEKERDYIDVVAFTHPHDDHVIGSEDFFWLDHAVKYQDEERIRINELWVPAAMVVATGLSGAAYAIRQEARHRLSTGSGIRVFSTPGQLEDWVDGQDGLVLDDVLPLITHAGELAPGFTADEGGAEVFVHAPFSTDLDTVSDDHNGSSLVLHLTFSPTGSATRAMFGADAEYEVWQRVVDLTERHGNGDRLDWDIFKVAHHCSHDALAPTAGDGTTVPVDEVAGLFDCAGSGCILIASCNPIDTDNTPPHTEAAAYYRAVASEHDGEFLVTMEYPSEGAPQPIVIEIGEDGPALQRSASRRWAGAAAVTSTRSSRYGYGL
jgi:hypothetical protein